jgi:hypothetical protein
MSQWDEDLEDVAQRLRESRPEASALELDHIKMRAMARAASSRPRGTVLKTRLLAALASLALMAGATGGVIAAQSGSASKGDAAKGQYGSPGKGCGNKNKEKTGPPGQAGNAKDCPEQAQNNPGHGGTPPGQSKPKK